jgi:hydrogenase expression/formation protein HypE
LSGAISEREAKVLGIIETARAKKARFRDKQITMAHGAGGKATQTLIEGLFVPAMGTGTLEQMADAGLVEIGGVKLAMTTDSFVIKPLPSRAGRSASSPSTAPSTTSRWPGPSRSV